MVSKLLDDEIVIASHNKGKIVEFADLFRGYNLNLSSSADYNIEEPEEKSDDSGLCVDSLNGEPGIYSARWAGSNKDFAMAMEKIKEKLLELDTKNTNAHFFCALAVVQLDLISVLAKWNQQRSILCLIEP